MQYLLLLHIDESGWDQLAPDQRVEGQAAYANYTASLRDAGTLVASARLTNSDAAKTNSRLWYDSGYDLIRGPAAGLPTGARTVEAWVRTNAPGPRIVSYGDFSVGRHLRDVLSAPIMINNDRILVNIATASLMSGVPASLRD